MSQTTTTVDTDGSPPLQPGPPNKVECNSATDSIITGVRVFSGRAEITRSFEFDIKAGQNQVQISGLPKVLDRKSVRVERDCKLGATIHGVTISMIVLPRDRSTPSLLLKEQQNKKRENEKASEQIKKFPTTLDAYLGLLKIEHLDSSNLQEAVTSYDEAVTRYDTIVMERDKKLAMLEDELTGIDELIKDEKVKLSGKVDPNLNLKASIGIFADLEGKIKIKLIYDVQGATWNAEYDIRVDTETHCKPVTLTYKGGITQNTGEDWVDVPITLETATPTIGLEVPTLTPVNIAIQRQAKSVKKSVATSSFSPNVMPEQASSPSIRWGGRVPKTESSNQLITQHPSSPIRWRRRVPPDESSNQPSIQQSRLDISSQGNVNTRFNIGKFSIGSGPEIIHNVTIAANLELNATMSRVCVPKKDTKTYLIAKITNDSSYTFLNGQTCIYVDDRFIAKADIPFVNSTETFDCPLGVDPSIRVTNHPRLEKVTQSGFYTKTTHYGFLQRITVSNTTRIPKDLKVIDQIHASEDSHITVKLVCPTLGVPLASGEVAQWHEADEVRDGTLSWVCAVSDQKKINLVLSWEVTVPRKTDIVGLKF